MWAIRKNTMGYTTELSFQSKPYYKGRLFKKSLSFCVGMRKGCPLYPWGYNPSLALCLLGMVPLFEKSLTLSVGTRKGCPLYPWAIILLSCCVYWDGASIIALVIIMISWVSLSMLHTLAHSFSLSLSLSQQVGNNGFNLLWFPSTFCTLTFTECTSWDIELDR